MGGTWTQDGDRFVNAGSGRIDVFENGLGRDVGDVRPDGRVNLGLHHDHAWQHGGGSGFADRSAEREALLRGLGSTAVNNQ